jgi:exonuclease III
MKLLLRDESVRQSNVIPYNLNDRTHHFFPPYNRNKRFLFSSFNVEGMKNVLKYPILINYMTKFSILIMAIQETHVCNTDHFVKDGFHFFFSGQAKDTHAGVGFIVSPKAVNLIIGFRSLSSRLCELTLRTAPLPTYLYSVYAPSQLPPGENQLELDAERKIQFWDHLNDNIKPANCRINLLLGDFNARITARPQGYEQYVGPYLFGKQTLQDSPFEQNSNHLLTFLTENDSFLPQTFFDIHPKNKITYLEISAEEGYNTFTPRPGDFSVLDYVIAPNSSKRAIEYVKSDSDFSFPSRHFPLLLGLCFSKQPYRRTSAPTNKRYIVPDTARKQQYHYQIHRSLFNHVPPPDHFDLLVYTDGSYEPGHSPKAGWGFAIFNPLEELRTEGHGPITSSYFTIQENEPDSYGSSNNIAELQAVI